jgi:signal transduction histidine kinase
MSHLINALLALARISRHSLEREPVDLSEMARAIFARLREAESGRPIEFLVAAGMGASVDRHLIEIALTNLLENAVKYSARRPDPVIEFGRQEEPVFFVRDNGVGFEANQAGRLFRAFERLQRRSEFPGTGIGLATVQRVIHRHGGRVWVEAAPGQGATFYFTVEA